MQSYKSNFPDSLMWLLLLLPIVSCSHQAFFANNLVIPEQKDLYEFWFDVQESMTMVLPSDDAVVLLWDKNTRQFHQRGGNEDDDSCGATVPFNPEDHRVPLNTGDGLHRRIMTINGSMPAETLIVYQGSKVHVHVRNLLSSESVMVHFHGMLHTNNMWHDGGGRLNTCPIGPGQTFTYRFVAETTGTYFYHGHFEDRGDGMEGAFVVLPRVNSTTFRSKAGYVTPSKQYIGFVQDWFPTKFQDQFVHVKWGTNRYAYGFRNMEKCYDETKTFDGSRIGQLAWHSALVNGRGWYSSEDLLQRPHDLPLETFRIGNGATIAIRFINAGVLFPLAISIDDHDLEVVASDANEINPITVDYLVIFPGERYTVLIKGLAEPAKWKYFIKIRSLEHFSDDMQPLDVHHFTLALLEYPEFDGEYQAEKPSSLQFDETRRPNVVKRMLNCPFQKFPHDYHINCINYDQITSPYPSPAVSDKVTTYNLNMFNDKSINGIRFKYPHLPPYFLGEKMDTLFNTEPCKGSSTAKCHHHIAFPLGHTARIVLYNRAKVLEDPNGLDAFAHPFHMHGYHFRVIQVGFPDYGSDGLINAFNNNIHCEDDACNIGKLKSSWIRPDPPSNGGFPVKDTIEVPVGGYVVIEFDATNPGWWPAHCHMLPHHMDGMAIAVKVGEFRDMPPMPDGYPMCNHTYY